MKAVRPSLRKPLTAAFYTEIIIAYACKLRVTPTTLIRHLRQSNTGRDAILALMLHGLLVESLDEIRLTKKVILHLWDTTVPYRPHDVPT